MAILFGEEFKIIEINNVEHVNTLLKPNRLVNYNRFSHAFVYKISGEVKYHFDDTTLHFTPGCVCYFPKNSNFTIENIILGECIAINFQTLDRLTVPPFNFKTQEPNRIHSLFDKLEILWAKRQCDFSYDVLAEVYKIADFIQSSMQNNCVENNGHKKIQSIRQYLLDNYANPTIKINEICSEFQTSASSARANFNDAYGISPKRYLITIRINAAKKLLLETSLSISEIAEKTGFYDMFYFSRCFSKCCGCSPSDYRKIHISSQF